MEMASDSRLLSTLVDCLDFDNPSHLDVTRLQDVLAKTRYEKVRAADVCASCLTLTTDPHDPPFFIRHFRARDEWRKGFRSRLRDAPTCWLCRLLCRIVAIGGRGVHSPSGSASKPQARDTNHGGRFEMAFQRCLRLDELVSLAVDNHLWDVDLRSSNASGARSGTDCATSYRLGFAWPTLRRIDGDWPNPGYAGLTRHSIQSPPKTRRRLLASVTHPLPAQNQTTDENQITTHRDDLIQQMHSWLRICKFQHQKCDKPNGSGERPSKPPHSGFRLIDVNSRDLVTPQTACQYVTLSYTWGKDPFSKPCTSPGQLDHPLLVSDVVKYVNKELKLPHTVPRTIEDALAVTRMIGQRFLWTDLLCIDQENADTKAEAIAAMGKVYSDSFLTICVLDGLSMFSGIPGIRSNFQHRFQVVTDTEDMRYMFILTRETKPILRDSSWAKRAWCFQEGELSRRRLCFAELGAFFLCREEIMFDTDEVDESEDRAKRCFQAGQALNQFLPFSFDLETANWSFALYARMVTSYSRRSMSYSSDALNAVAGALDVLSATLNVKFAAGLPTLDIDNALLWTKRRPQEIETDESAGGVRRSGFPSWSWAGWEGNIEHCFWLQEARDPSASAKGIFSFIDLTDGTEGYIYPDSIQVISRAIITVEPSSSTSSSSTDHAATLHLQTPTAKFRVKQLTEPNEEHDVGWVLINNNDDTNHNNKHGEGEGDAISRGTSPSIHYPLDYDVWPLCWFPLHESVAAQLTSNSIEELEFAMLQHWATVPSPFPPENYDKTDFEEIPPALSFEETVYAMALRKVKGDGGNGDGDGGEGGAGAHTDSYERLNLVAIPAEVWLAAKPQMSSLRVV